jgi:[acyl-carrier-protein] S-malonyltransferase
LKKLAILFPGQGSQYVGMGKGLYRKYPAARHVFDEANDILGFDLAQLCFDGNMEELTRTENAQPAIFTCSVALFEIYRQEIGIDPRLSAGHSLGEISALTCAGSIKFSDALKLIRQRGLLMRDAMADSEGAMAAVTGIGREAVQAECAKFNTSEKIVVISNYNSSDQVVISGHKPAVAEAGKALENQGAKVIPLKVSAPFHSPLMRPAADKFAAELKKYNYQPLKWPVISNVTGAPYPDSNQIVTLLTEQLTQAVRWQESMAYLQNQGIEMAVEVGPQTVLRNLMKSNASQIKTFSYDKEDDVKSLKEVVGAVAVSKNDFQHTVVTKCIQITVCTRNRNWDNDEYQKGVVEPYRRIQKMQEELEKSNQPPTLEQMKEALEMLRSVFITKKTPPEEQRERFNEVFDVTGTRQLFPDFK